MLRKDVEDQRGAVDDLDLDDVLELTQLTGSQLAVADHRVGAVCRDDIAQLLGLAGPDVGGRVGTVTALDQPFEDVRAGRLGQPGQLAEGVLRLDKGAGRPDADEYHPFQAELPVLDLADVREFGGEAGDPAQRIAFLEVEVVLR